MQIGEGAGLTPAKAEALARALELELAKATKEINAMSQLKGLGAMVRDAVVSLEAEAGKVAARMGALRDRGAGAFGKLHSELDQVEAAIVEAEGALAPVTNGGPPLGNG